MRIKRTAIATALISFFSTTVAAQQPYDFGTHLAWCYMIEDGEVVDLSEMCDRPATTKPVAASPNPDNPRALITREQSEMLRAVGKAQATFFCNNRKNYLSPEATISAAQAEVKKTIAPSDLALVESPLGVSQLGFIRRNEITMQCPALDGGYRGVTAR